MALSVQIGLLCAVATAFTAIIAFLYKQRGAVASPEVELRRPIRTSLALFRSPWYVLGIALASASWVFHVAALKLAPISLAQAVIAGGLVLLTVVADRLFGFTVTRREWIGVALTAAGLALRRSCLFGRCRRCHSAGLEVLRARRLRFCLAQRPAMSSTYGMDTARAGIAVLPLPFEALDGSVESCCHGIPAVDPQERGCLAIGDM